MNKFSTRQTHKPQPQEVATAPTPRDEHIEEARSRREDRASNMERQTPLEQADALGRRVRGAGRAGGASKQASARAAYILEENIAYRKQRKHMRQLICNDIDACQERALKELEHAALVDALTISGISLDVW